MNNLSNKFRYWLLKIESHDTFSITNLSDYQKYPNRIGSDNVEEFLDQIPKEISQGQTKYIIINLDRIIFDSDMLFTPVVLNAFLLICKYHRGQKRKGDGFPYLEHPLEVGYTLWQNKFSDDIVAAGFCHDL